MFPDLLPVDVVVVTTDQELGDARLYPEEEAHVERAIEKRKREFTLGRRCAREGLRRLGAPVGPLLAGPDRAPLWPDGVVGSITHCDGHAAAAVAWQDRYLGLGIDAEVAGPLDPKLTHLICTPEEERRFAGRAPLRGTDWTRLAFSAKECVHKVVAPASGVTLHFHDVEIDFGADGEWTARYVGSADPRVPDLAPVRGRYALERGLVLTTAILPAGE